VERVKKGKEKKRILIILIKRSNKKTNKELENFCNRQNIDVKMKDCKNNGFATD